VGVEVRVRPVVETQRPLVAEMGIAREEGGHLFAPWNIRPTSASVS
jgi:hypothetical protein